MAKREEISRGEVADWLKRTYPNDENFQVSHETIYKGTWLE